jgi:hypothetical protein
LEAVSRELPDQEPQLNLERRINSSKNGLVVTWHDLNEIARGLFQTINGILVGLSPDHAPPTVPVANDYSGPFIIIEAIDSSLWAVTSNDESVIGNIQRHFKDVRLA